MIPYVITETVRIGPLTLHVWGFFVALGILVGTWIAARRAAGVGISATHVVNSATWMLIGGIIGARLTYLAEYWHEVGWTVGLLRVQDGGLSATGAVLGGLICFWWYTHRRHLSCPRLADAMAPGILLGEGLGRLGCFFIHDHLGRPTTFALSVVVNGVQRHEVGLELSLVGFAGAVILLTLERTRWVQGRRYGSLAALALLWYALTRLGLDFLRATDLPASDIRYAGLTIAQYAAAVGIATGLWYLRRAHDRLLQPVRRSSVNASQSGAVP